MSAAEKLSELSIIDDPEVDSMDPETTGTNISKKGLKKLMAAKEKEKRKRETQARLEEEKRNAEALDFAKENYGNLPVNQSAHRINKVWTQIRDIHNSNENKNLCIGARLHNSRGTGKNVFIVLRDGYHTLQAIVSVDNVAVSRDMVKFAASIPKESIIQVEGPLVKVDQKIESCSHHWHELHVKKIFVISESANRLPMSIDDASRPEEELEAEDSKSHVRVNLDTRLNNRVIDLRTVTNQAIFKISHGIETIFRDYFNKHGFIGIHSPKLVSSGSEGGANVFKMPYFGREAFLAQSPQLYKQMAICSDFDRVFEIGPVFRAENSFTHRHMTEFIGVDLEMRFDNHYHEVLDLICDMFVYLFDQIKARLSTELNIVRSQYPFEDLKYLRKTLVLKFSEGIHLLREAGVEVGEYDDLSTTQEKMLGKIVKEKYHTDVYVLDKFPLNVRPFYTMPDAHDKNYSNSYDFFLRGEEILSGAQRIHKYDLLNERAALHGINLANIQDYLEAFKYGAPPHAGGGIGLERVVMLYLNLGNIRKSSLFPRDPNRLTP